jgi:hypothetical protein
VWVVLTRHVTEKEVDEEDEEGGRRGDRDTATDKRDYLALHVYKGGARDGTGAGNRWVRPFLCPVVTLHAPPPHPRRSRSMPPPSSLHWLTCVSALVAVCAWVRGGAGCTCSGTRGRRGCTSTTPTF